MESIYYNLQRASLWAVNNPKRLLVGWFVTWAVALYGTLQTAGFVPTVQIATTGMFSLVSVLGLPLPLFSLYLIHRKNNKNSLKTEPVHYALQGKQQEEFIQATRSFLSALSGETPPKL